MAIRRVPMESRTLRRETPSYPRTVLGLRSCQPFCFHPTMASLMVVAGPQLRSSLSGLRAGRSSYCVGKRASSRSAARLVPSNVVYL